MAVKGMSVLLLLSVVAAAFTPAAYGQTEKDIRALFNVWNDALATEDPKQVAALYTEDAVLLPTLSNKARNTPEEIEDYFVGFLAKKPQGEILEGKIKIGEGWARDGGIYEFTLGVDGSKVQARYSFVYVLTKDGEWMIDHHHSSMLPETAPAITEEEVRGLFDLWNDALPKGSKTVAKRYSKDAVLLPTLSDIPRFDEAGIIDYFDLFLQKDPQGEILEGEIIVGNGWAQDAGIYEFTMGVDGSKARARYSYVYVWEDGEWKISHHHSSLLPEGTQPTPITEEEVRDLFLIWNDALATGKPRRVQALYTRDASLLPTLSDTPRNSPAAIRDYFKLFLQKKPQGVILEGEIKIGHNWAQDAGIYEFTDGNDGSKVQARYSFVYVWENGKWMISHHHSSILPEGAMDAMTKVAELEKIFA